MSQDNDDFLQNLSGTQGASVTSLSQLWAKKYVQNLVEIDNVKKGRANTAQGLLYSLRSSGVNAWLVTESMLAREVQRHRIDPGLIDPWEISKDIHDIYKKLLSAYANDVIPRRFSLLISSDIGRIRRKWTKQDPRLISFVSMQFHHTGQELVGSISLKEKILFGEYLKVIDDHLYMPLQRAYEAAAQHDYESPPLAVVRHILPVSTKIAKEICQRVIEVYPNYRSKSGLLSDPSLQISSIRDVEMFQVYLWVCVLEGNMAAIQQELFPLCLMLYPTLRVSWELVRLMLYLMGKKIANLLGQEQATIFQPYFRELWSMFSPEVLPAIEP